MPPYQPLIEALGRYARSAAPARLQAQLGDAAAEVGLLVGEVRARLPRAARRKALSAEHERSRLWEGVTGFLLAIATEAPLSKPDDADLPAGGGASRHPAGLLLCLDDLHWADVPTLLLVQQLVRRIDDAPLLVVGTYRAAEAGPGHPLAAIELALRREGLAERIALEAPAEAAAVRLIAALTGRPAAAAVVQALYCETREERGRAIGRRRGRRQARAGRGARSAPGSRRSSARPG